MNQLNDFDKAILTAKSKRYQKQNFLKSIQQQIDELTPKISLSQLADRCGQNGLNYIKQRDTYDRLILFKQFVEGLSEPDLM